MPASDYLYWPADRRLPSFMPAAKLSLDDLRREIDEIDDTLHDLLMRRTELAGQIGAAKGDGAVYIRPGREARVLRRLMARHRGRFPKPVVVRIWREIMAVFGALQGPFAVAVYAENGDGGLRTRARDHYGSLTPFTSYETTLGVVRAVTEGRATLGVLPLPESDDADPWWRTLASDGEGTPRIVGRVPFVSMAPSLGDGVAGLVVALAAPEESGQDRGFVVIETAEQVSRGALTGQLAALGLEVLDVKHWDDMPDQRLHLIEVEGYLAADDPRLAGLRRDDDQRLRFWVIGGYAVPLDAAEPALEWEEA